MQPQTKFSIALNFVNYISIYEYSNIVLTNTSVKFQHIHGDDAWRDKRKIEHKFDIKNAILGLVFNVSTRT